MPGLVGIIQALPNSPERTRLLGTMLQAMYSDRSESPGQCSVESVGLAAGWLAGAGSFSELLPVWSTTRRICLLFTGEAFSDGVQNASTLADLYEKQGATFFGCLNGWFSGLVVDLRDNTATLFNDRYGLNRLYYYQSAEGFYFASEAKCLLAIHPHLRRIDQRSLAEFYSLGCVLQNRSIFPDISLLPGGSCWTFYRDGRIDKKRYFEPATWEQQEPLNAAEYTERLIEVFARIAPRYEQGKERVAMSLTGGLDSRMLLAWMKAKPGSLPCYTFGGPYRDCADVRIARKLAKVCGQPHTLLPIANDFFPDFPSLAQSTILATDGTMDASGAVEIYVNRLARQIAPVRLTGNYGSEILRSNVAFRPGKLDTSLFTPEFSTLIDEAKNTYRKESEGHRLSFIAFKQVPWHHYARHAAERSQLTPRSPFLDNELVELAYRVPPGLATDVQPLLKLIATGNPALDSDSVATDRALRRKAIPFVGKLTHAWQEFTAKAEYAYDYGMPRRLTRIDHALSGLHLEKLFLGRHKFYHYRTWYRNQLSDFLRSLRPVSGASSSCYREGAMEQIIQDHLKGRCNRTLELHKLLTVQFIDQLLIRRS
jgi:asparagine synthase (glutamine-hydrolysing)